MPWLFTFDGKIGRLRYAACALAVFFSQHLVIAGIVRALGQPLDLELWSLVAPLRMLMRGGTPAPVLLPALAYGLIVAWALAALAFRRAADAAISEWIAAYAIAPLVQIPIIVLLCIAPSRHARESAASPVAVPQKRWMTIAQGVLAGIAVTLFAVAVGALVFRTYGYGIFVASPFVIGATTGYFANRHDDIGIDRTVRVVALAAILGGAALVVTALEGAVCIVMAAPLGIAVALAGGCLGRVIALRKRRAPETLSAVALLPLIFALEAVLPPMTSFDTVETMTVDAPPARVWESIVHMARIDAPLALPFRLGVAYPLGGEIIGEGVGAVRRGEFSTGTATERVTEWVTDRKLAFTVLDDVPAMRELSPYAHVHAPHLIGYFRTTLTSFELVPLPDGRTEIVERTAHQLRLDPVFYWLPLARLIVHENNARVLEHIKRQAEAPDPNRGRAAPI